MVAQANVKEIIDAAMSDLGFVRSAQRAPILDAVNRCERFLANLGPMLYLERRTTIQLANNDVDTAAPADYAYGKEAHISETGATRRGELTWLPPGEIDSIGDTPTGNTTDATRPSYWTFTFTGSGPFTGMVVFAPMNTSGSAITYNFQYQRRVDVLTDVTTSFSLVPPGWELTLLLDLSVWLMKEKLHWPVSQKFDARLDAQMAAFVGEQLVSKDAPSTIEARFAREAGWRARFTGMSGGS